MAASPRSLTPTTRRRAVLAALGTGMTGVTGGCMGRLRAMTGWESTQQVSLEIKTVPADADPYALRIARQIATWFREAGIEMLVTPMSGEELFRHVLIRADFDLFVARVPNRFRAPDSLSSLVHSQFVDAPGWQNPFGYTNLEVDDLLDSQRRSVGKSRRDAIARLQRILARTQPFSVLAFPDDIRASRSDRFVNWDAVDLRSPLGYVRIARVGAGRSVRYATQTVSTETQGDAGLRMVTTDQRPTENLNPLSVEFRRDGLLTGLLYDSLGYHSDIETVEPWLATSWWFHDGGGNPRATVELRSDCTWHDGEPLTADDVAFTYAFLADTSMGGTADSDDSDENDGPIPAPRFQGRTQLVDEVRAVDEETVRVDFTDCNPSIATRAFSVPILPRHVWREQTGTASLGGIEMGPATDALVTNNIPPVGSGPLQFVRNTPHESLVLDQFDDHFLSTADAADLPSGLAGPPEFDRLTVRAVTSDETAIELVATGDADVTGTTVGAGTVPRIGRENDLDLLVDRSDSPFFLGYNARRPPLTNPRFRNILARLIDQSAVVDDAFEGYATPAASPLAWTEWLPDDLRWNGDHPVVPFLGADGTLDEGRARDAFREAGYQYEERKLMERQ